MVHMNLVKKVIDVKRLNSRIVVMEFAGKNEVLSMLSVYTLQSGLSIEKKTYFTRDKSDFRRHAVKKQDGYERLKECMEALVMESEMWMGKEC